jgi:hypothetical protein
MSSALFAAMKKKGYLVELVTEYIKKWAYMKRAPKGFETLYVFSKQLHTEDVFLRHGVHHIVTDSPVLLNCAYSAVYNHPIANHLLEIARKWEEEYPSLNIWLDKEEWIYQPAGRFETAEQALEREIQLRDWIVNKSGIVLKVFKSTDMDSILNFIEERLRNGSNS